MNAPNNRSFDLSKPENEQSKCQRLTFNQKNYSLQYFMLLIFLGTLCCISSFRSKSVSHIFLYMLTDLFYQYVAHTAMLLALWV
jgi:predicted permease